MRKNLTKIMDTLCDYLVNGIEYSRRDTLDTFLDLKDELLENYDITEILDILDFIDVVINKCVEVMICPSN